MSTAVDVAIIGAGPYGLSLAAHLRAAGVDYRHFGMPMRLWRAAMPRGMFLKSQGFACNISDPHGTHTLEAFCKATNRPYASYGRPVCPQNASSVCVPPGSDRLDAKPCDLSNMPCGMADCQSRMGRPKWR